jgi:pseudaminic acid synthase
MDLAIGDGFPTFVIAEISGNHAGKIENAIHLIEESAKAGADAVKFQAYTADSITIDSEFDDFRIPSGNSWEKYSTLFNLYKTAQTPFEWIPELFKAAKRFSVPVFASVFDLTSIELLENHDPFAYKVASPEASDSILLKRLGKTRKPVFISTGLSNASEIYESNEILLHNGCPQVIWLKASTAYPAPLQDINLRTIEHMKDFVKGPVGFSDHTLDIEIAVAAVAQGANAIEKHIKLSDSQSSVDDFFSLSPSQFKHMVHCIRNVEAAIGVVNYDIPASSRENLNGKRSLYCVEDIKPGELFTSANVRSIRPSFGLPISYYESIIGKRSRSSIVKGQRLSLSHVDLESEE